MNDYLKRYHAIKEGLSQLYPKHASRLSERSKGNFAAVGYTLRFAPADKLPQVVGVKLLRWLTKAPRLGIKREKLVGVA